MSRHDACGTAGRRPALREAVSVGLGRLEDGGTAGRRPALRAELV
jgi:hypothetical protein